MSRSIKHILKEELKCQWKSRDIGMAAKSECGELHKGGATKATEARRGVSYYSLVIGSETHKNK